MLFHLMRMPLPPAATPRVLGVDDFALYADVYGTLLVDADIRLPLPLTLWDGTPSSWPPGCEDAAEAFYRIIDAAYERRSIAVTSNIHPSGFDTIMPKTLAGASTDHLMHTLTS